MIDEICELMTVDELCETLSIGRNTAYRLLNSGELGVFRIGRCWKIPREAVQTFLQQGTHVLQTPKSIR